MKKIYLLYLLFSAVVFAQPNAWINEFHYDNASTDEGEFVEIVVQNPSSYSLADFTVTLYNGSGGVSYGTFPLSAYNSTSTDLIDPSFSFYSILAPGFQNGAPDGLSLDYQGTVIMFLSYEGSFTATNGPASGITSTDIGVLELGTTSVGFSLQLNGKGPNYSDYSWGGPITATPGIANTNQELPVELTSFSALVVGSSVKLNWQTATEVNNYGFEIQKKSPSPTPSLREGALDWEKIGFVAGSGNSNSQKSYSFTDDLTLNLNHTLKAQYRLKQIDNDGQFEYSKVVEVSSMKLDGFSLEQNYPNPFNPNTTIKFNLPEAGYVKLTLYNILGQEIRTLLNENKEAGLHTLSFDATGLNSGTYIYKIESSSNGKTQIQTRKMTLLK